MRFSFLIAAAALMSLSAVESTEASSLSVIYGFCQQKDCADGRNPENPVSADTSGNLYGVSEFSSTTHFTGVLYKLAPNGDGSYSQSVLWKFCDASKKCRKGDRPNGQLAVDPAGNVFGTTFEGDGGKANSGILYEVTASKSYKVVYKFCPDCSTSERPVSGLTWAGAQTGAPWDGKAPLYAITTNDPAGAQAGNLYKFTISKHGKVQVRKIFEFIGEFTGALTVDNSGNLFYNTRDPNNGNLFKLSFDGTQWVNTELWKFCAGHTDCSEGKDPRSLVVDATGNLYGTTAAGGANKNGTLYRLAAPAYTNMSVLHSFCVDKTCTDGVMTSFSSPMAVDSTANVYGVTTNGGGNDFMTDKSGAGVLFRIGSDGSYTNVHSFCGAANCADGANPLGGVTIDDAGDVLGTTLQGGPQAGSGEVFRFTP